VRQLDLHVHLSAALGAVPDDLMAGPIGLAVSGGSDSSALLHLVHRWALARRADLIVLTVDHRLRDGSGADAAALAGIASGLGLAHRTLVWDAPVSRHAAARRARHRLLASAMRDAGGKLLLTGHTVDDQAETVLMRLRQGSGPYGLAGMRAVSPSPVWPEGEGIWIARPLLGETRRDLRVWLAGQGACWTEDPSNANTAFERVRIRQRLGAHPGLTARVLACQTRFAVLRAINDAGLARWLGEAVRATGDGAVLAGFNGEPCARAARGLGIIIQCVTGRGTPPRSEALAALAARLALPDTFRGATLGGARLKPSRGAVRISAEHAGNPGLPGPGEVSARLDTFRRLFLNSAQEIAAGGGKESFLKELVPIFSRADVSSATRDLP
jgi:tRNA(Ile)-lysidine synthase